MGGVHQRSLARNSLSNSRTRMGRYGGSISGGIVTRLGAIAIGPTFIHPMLAGKSFPDTMPFWKKKALITEFLMAIAKRPVPMAFWSTATRLRPTRGICYRMAIAWKQETIHAIR